MKQRVGFALIRESLYRKLIKPSAAPPRHYCTSSANVPPLPKVPHSSKKVLSLLCLFYLVFIVLYLQSTNLIIKVKKILGEKYMIELLGTCIGMRQELSRCLRVIRDTIVIKKIFVFVEYQFRGAVKNRIELPGTCIRRSQQVAGGISQGVCKCKLSGIPLLQKKVLQRMLFSQTTSLIIEEFSC